MKSIRAKFAGSKPRSFAAVAVVVGTASVGTSYSDACGTSSGAFEPPLQLPLPLVVAVVVGLDLDLDLMMMCFVVVVVAAVAVRLIVVVGVA